MTGKIQIDPTKMLAALGWVGGAVRGFCQGSPGAKRPPNAPCPPPPNLPPPPPPRPPYGPPVRRPIHPIFRPFARPLPEVKYLPGADNPDGNKVIETDSLQIGNNQPETVYEIIRWDYRGGGRFFEKKSPIDRLQDLKKMCSRDLEQREGQKGLECTIDSETQGLAEEQTEIWEGEKNK